VSRKLAVVLFVMAVLVASMGLKTLVAGQGDGSVIMAAGSAPVPPGPPLYRAGSAPVPPGPPLYRAGSAPVPPGPPLYRAGSAPVPPGPPLAVSAPF